MKSTTIQPNFEELPITLRDFDQWVLWREVPDHSGKSRKVPCQTSGIEAKANDASTWTTFDAVTSAYDPESFTGVGFYFPVNQPAEGEFSLVGVDLDGCRNPDTGELDEWAFDVLTSFGGTYAEVSPSGTGVKLLAIGVSPFETGKNQDDPGAEPRFGKRVGLEIYDHGRFFTLTGNRLPNAASEPIIAPPEALARVKATVDKWSAEKRSRKAAERNAVKPEATVTPTACVTSGDVVERCRKYIGMMPGAIDGQSGHSQTFNVACVIARFGLGESDGRALLDEYNSRCQPPWDDRELEHKLTSAYERVKSEGTFGSMGAARQSATNTTNTTTTSTTTSTHEDQQDVTPRPLAIRPARSLITEFPSMRPIIIDGLLRRGETANVIAAPKVGKSWLVLDLALAVATGRDWLGHRTTAGRVLILDNELHAETTANRLPKVAAARGIMLDEYADRIDVANLRGDCVSIEDLPGRLASVEPGTYSVLVLDAFYKFFAPGADENKNADVARMYAILDGITARLGCAAVAIHHLSKGVQANKSVTDSGAGAGSQSRAADAHLVLRQHEEPDVVVLDAVTRSFPSPAPVCLRREWPVFNVAHGLDPAALFNPGKKPKGDKAAEPVRDYRTFVHDVIGPLPMTKSGISVRAAQLGYSDRQTDKYLSQAVSAELVVEYSNPGDKRQKLYQLPTPSLVG